ncbi:MAG: hypothetical protein ACE5MB_12200, partial [Anaerolineae bacterium]
MTRKALLVLTLLSLAVACSASGRAASSPSSSGEQQPFYVTLAFHLDVPFPWEAGPTPETATI